jgi:heavy metal translocating P-type ATPase
VSRSIAASSSLATPLVLLGLTLVGLVLGIAAAWQGANEAAALLWGVPAGVMGLRLAVSIVRDLLARRAGVDLIALLAIAGALALGETFAAGVIGLMLASGETLEAYAEGRARRDLSLLLGRAPQVAHRRRGETLEDVPLDAVAPGDRILVRPGEVVPVDGRILSHAAALDESALTGESRVVVRAEGELVASGVVNAGGPLELQAVATAAESTYAGIVRLVEEVGRSRAPLVRLADRYALAFVPLTLGIAAGAALLAGTPERALAVLVAATPCPLILAAPIAIVAGISRAARRGVIVKGGGPLETLARARLLLLDKTGTLTVGRPRVATVERPGGDPQELLRLAAGLEQASPHVFAAAIVQAAREGGLSLPIPTDVTEIPGAGIQGRVDGRCVAVGSAEFVAGDRPQPPWAREVRRRTWLEGATPVFVALDGELAGAIVLDDPLRPEAPRAIRALRRIGFSRIVMVTGDHVGVAELVGAAVGVDAVLAERSPADKVDAVVAERELGGGPLVMVGDGINDAPALAAADVGVAMGARGATASSEAADVVITVDRLDRLAEAVAVARRARFIAIQSIVVGMGLSLVAMLAAAAGAVPVVGGAILQEGIDVLAILNALRALTGGALQRPIRVPGWRERRAGLLEAHRQMAPDLARLRQLADALDGLDPAEARRQLEAVRRFLVETIVPHELEEDRVVYPQLAAALESEDATAALHHTHVEIFHLVRLFARAVADLDPDGPSAEDWPDLRRLLYGLDAILRLHWAQEEEFYGSLAEEDEVRLAAQPA